MSAKQQILITLNGETRNLKQWCRFYQISYDRTYYRVRSGIDPVKALLDHAPLRGKIFITIDGETRTLTDWCKIYEVPFKRVYNRMVRGKSFEQAIQAPGRQVKKITLAGQTRLRTGWLRRVGLSSSAWYCRKRRGWSDEQMLQPKMTTRLYKAFDREQTLKAWCIERNKNYKTVQARMSAGKSLELALTLAVGKYERRKTKTSAR